MGSITALIRRLDGWQQRHALTAVIWSVNKKYGDDRGGYLSALIAYYGFISLFPLMLAFFSIAAWVLPGHSSVLSSLDRKFSGFPVLGPSIHQLQGHSLSGSALAVVIGFVGLIWGSTGLAKTLKYATDEAWNVPNTERVGFPKNQLLAFEWAVVFAVGIIVSTFLSSLANVLNWGPAGPVLSALPALVVNVAVYMATYKLFLGHRATWRQLLPGSFVGGAAWTALTTVGINLLTHQVKHASALYGTIGTTIGFIGFIYLIARLSLYGCELNVVLDHHLWPRSILQPPLTDADKRQLANVAEREERVKEEKVRVDV